MLAPEDRLRHTRARVERHSRIVRWMKIALPVVALLLIGAIFLVGRERAAVFDPGTAAQLAAMGTGMRLDNPRFSGVTEEGDPFTVTADWALPDGAVPDRIDLEKPVGELQMGEQAVTVTAETGALFRDAERLRLKGDVVLETSDGYRIETPSVEVDLATKTAEAPRRLRAEGPRGSIEADRVRLTRGEGADDLTIRFEGDVRVNWQPAGNGQPGE
ncbi:MAG TPA: LPS export ABC transporter periplasmic protein LptC [Paracoccaceae bacterium]|nr:LPS export ABC transporter periplasmic protein LptC [Paracoccaceae bacterium]